MRVLHGMNKPELLAPAGNMEMLAAAIDSGADAVFFGVEGMNMRAGADNFSLQELDKVVERCHKAGRKAYLCVNTIIPEEELDILKDVLMAGKNARADAVICWDLSVIRMARAIGLEVHLSTQASASNSAALKEYKKLGVSRAVLARECTLEQIRAIREKTDIELEAFVHGAMCVAVSGRCFMSEHLYGRSANRGECIQPCRRSYIVTDPETGKELELSDHHVMSPKDLCTIGFIDRLMDAGIDAFKIEGRNRSPEYVKIAVECYKEAIGLHRKGKLTPDRKEELKKRLAEVYNRGFSGGFYMGRPVDEWTDTYGSRSAMVKEYVGKVRNYYARAGACEIFLETGRIRKGDRLLFIGPTTGCEEAQAESVQVEGKVTEEATKGQSVGIAINFRARAGDNVYLWRKRTGKDNQG